MSNSNAGTFMKRRGRPPLSSYCDDAQKRGRVLAKMTRETGREYLALQSELVRLTNGRKRKRPAGRRIIPRCFAPKRLQPGWQTGFLRVIGLTGRNHRRALLYTCECLRCGAWIDRAGTDLRQAHRRGHVSACYACYRAMARERSMTCPEARQAQKDVRHARELTRPLFIAVTGF
jgi:hypothetical protein